MSSAICNVIVGCEIPEQIRHVIEEHDDCFDDISFTSLYSASGQTPYYAGVHLFEFSYETMLLSDLVSRAKPTESQFEEARVALVNARESLLEKFSLFESPLDEDEKERLIKLVPTSPQVLLLWSDS